MLYKINFIIFSFFQLAIEALNRELVDEVWIVPCGDRTDKKIQISGETRLKMLKISVESFFRNEFPVKVSKKNFIIIGKKEGKEKKKEEENINNLLFINQG